MTRDIKVPVDSLADALGIARKLGLSLADDTILRGDTLTISGDAIAEMLEAYVRGQERPQPPAIAIEPRRIDRTVKLSPADEATVWGIQRDLGIDAGGVTHDDDLRAIVQYRAERLAKLRLSIITPIAQGDVSGITYVYGGELVGALTLAQPTGERLECDTLIHLSHPCSPEDLHLRELGIRARRIYRYHIPGLDDAPWARQGDVLRWPMTALEYRELLLERNQQM